MDVKGVDIGERSFCFLLLLTIGKKDIRTATDMPSTRSSTKSTQALERAYADPATLTEAIADRPLTKAEKLWAFQQLALREKYGPGQITVPLPKMGRISPWASITALSLSLCLRGHANGIRTELIR